MPEQCYSRRVAWVAMTTTAPDPTLMPPGGYALPLTLTPSKISAFTSCPLAFRFSVIEHRPEPSSLPAVRGTLVHRALQLLFTYTEAGERSPSRAYAALEQAFGEIADSDEFAGLALDADGRTRLFKEATTLVDRYFELEDPNTVTPVGLEIDLSVAVDGMQLRGIIDRLDVLADGRFAVVDYKTGRAPRADQAKSRLSGVQMYALLCEQILGVRPAVVRLLYLRDRVVVSSEPTDLSMRGVRLRAGAVWKAIERACDTADFRPSPSGLCSWCGFQNICPAFGGDPTAP
jgi:putative RecB family exonuclease